MEINYVVSLDTEPASLRFASPPARTPPAAARAATDPPAFKQAWAQVRQQQSGEELARRVGVV
jgi:hypothetical protein